MDTQGPNLPALQDARTSLGLTAPLTFALTLPSDEAIDRIASDDVLLAEARTQLPLVRARISRPATTQDLKDLIMARMQTYPQPMREDWEWSLFWADYTATLEGLTRESIEAGLKAWVASNAEFLPKPGQLRSIAMSQPTRTLLMLNTLSLACQEGQRREDESRAALQGQREAPHVRPRYFSKPKDDREAVAGMRDDWLTLQELRRAERPRVDARPTHGPLAEGHHVTAEMLSVLKRQTEEVDAAREASRAMFD
jgi:hypothetical protein